MENEPRLLMEDFYAQEAERVNTAIQNRDASLIETPNGYFNLEGWLVLSGVNWVTDDASVIICGPRNIGKSYATWRFVEEKLWIPSNYQYKVAYVRTNLTKLKNQKDGFNDKFKNKYYMSDTTIWKITHDTEGLPRPRAEWIEIGGVFGANNADNYKSMFTEGYRMIFFDEFNEKRQVNGALVQEVGLWEKWIDLLKTIKREKSPFLVVMHGNKVDGGNDILVNLEVELPPENYVGDYYFQVSKSIHYIEVGFETYNRLTFNYNDQVNEWAAHKDTTNAYINEGRYLTMRDPDIVLYKKVKTYADHEIKRNVALGERVFEMGEYNNGCYYFKELRRPIEGLPIMSLDNMGFMLNKKAYRLVDEDEYLNVCRMLKYKIKKQQLHFCSYDAKNELLSYIVLSTEIFD